jgi:hypothetical protein
VKNWTARNWINVTLAALCGGAIVALTVSPLGLDAAHHEGALGLAVGLLTGLITPGSPVGRALDALIPSAVAK